MNDLKIGPCAVIFRDEFLGVCDDGLQFSGTGAAQSVTAQQSYGQALDRTLTALSLTVTADIVRSARAMALLFDENGALGLSSLGQRFSSRSGELRLIPLNPLDSAGYRMRRAVPNLNFQYQFKASSPHTVRVVFDILPDADSLLVQCIEISEADRVLIPANTIPDVLELEQSLAAWLAALLGLTMNQDIFCARIPSEKYGCVVAVEGKSSTDSVREFDQYRAYVEFCHRNRTEVLAAMNSLAGMLPFYGLDFAQFIRDEGQSYPVPAAEDSNSLYRGKITLSITI